MNKKHLSVLLATVITLGTGLTANAVDSEEIYKPEVKRLEGETRFETAIKVSQTFTSSENAILAYGFNYPDALSASGLSKALKAPILLIQKDEISTEVKEELARLGVKNIYLVGGNQVIAKALEEELAKTYKVTRLWGEDRYETNKAINEEVDKLSEGKYKEKPHKVFAYGGNFPDALTATNLLQMEENEQLREYTTYNKIVLVDGKTQYTPEESDFTMGGDDVIPSELIKTEFPQRADGIDRYDTALKAMQWAIYGTNRPNRMNKSKNIIIASGENYPDALVASGMMFNKDASIVITEKDKLSDAAKMLIKRHSGGNPFESITIMGGTEAVSKAVEEEVREMKFNHMGLINQSSPETPEEPQINPENPIEDNKIVGIPVFERDIDKELSEKEKELAKLINDYRESLGLKRLPISKSLTFVARCHVWDSNTNHPEGKETDHGTTNLHSWSDKGNWTPVEYTGDRINAKGLWGKPSELTKFKERGYEISCVGSGIPQRILEAWKKSEAHNNIIIGKGYWNNLSSMGVAIDGEYAHVWFSESVNDPSGFFK